MWKPNFLFSSLKINLRHMYSGERILFKMYLTSTFKTSPISMSKGVARIQCTNTSYKYEYFRPFSCKTFYFCPSCSQKRTLLFSEHMNEQLLLQLPHRQFVFTFPKILRPFFRHDRRLFSEISRLIFSMIQAFYDTAAGKKIETGAVLTYQS